MLLSTLDREDWKIVAPYIDTICLPIYSISSFDKQFDVKKAQEIEQIASRVEKKITGRLLLLPAVCYTGGDPSIFQQYLKQIMGSFLQSGFHYAITISDQAIPTIDQKEIKHLHFNIDQDSKEQVEESAENCFQQILHLWVKNI